MHVIVLVVLVVLVPPSLCPSLSIYLCTSLAHAGLYTTLELGAHTRVGAFVLYTRRLRVCARINRAKPALCACPHARVRASEVEGYIEGERGRESARAPKAEDQASGGVRVRRSANETFEHPARGPPDAICILHAPPRAVCVSAYVCVCV